MISLVLAGMLLGDVSGGGCGFAGGKLSDAVLATKVTGAKYAGSIRCDQSPEHLRGASLAPLRIDRQSVGDPDNHKDLMGVRGRVVIHRGHTSLEVFVTGIKTVEMAKNKEPVSQFGSVRQGNLLVVQFKGYCEDGGLGRQVESYASPDVFKTKVELGHVTPVVVEPKIGDLWHVDLHPCPIVQTAGFAGDINSFPIGLKRKHHEVNASAGYSEANHSRDEYGERPKRHFLLGLQVILGALLFACGALLLKDAVRIINETRFARTGFACLLLGGIGCSGGGMLALLGLFQWIRDGAPPY